MSRILLIDDTPEIAELLTFSLQDLGYEVFAEGYSSAINEHVIEGAAHVCRKARLMQSCSTVRVSI